MAGDVTALTLVARDIFGRLYNGPTSDFVGSITCGPQVPQTTRCPQALKDIT